MDPKFDDFYEQELKVTYTACMEGYLPQYEGALEPIPYPGNWSTEVVGKRYSIQHMQ